MGSGRGRTAERVDLSHVRQRFQARGSRRRRQRAPVRPRQVWPARQVELHPRVPLSRIPPRPRAPVGTPLPLKRSLSQPPTPLT